MTVEDAATTNPAINMSHQPPGKQAPLFAVCYDLSNDRERRRVDRLLTGFGFRVQKSVFECRLPVGALRQLQQGLDRLGLTSGHVRLYRVYAGGSSPRIGKPNAAADDNHAFVVDMTGFTQR